MPDCPSLGWRQCGQRAHSLTPATLSRAHSAGARGRLVYETTTSTDACWLDAQLPSPRRGTTIMLDCPSLGWGQRGQRAHSSTCPTVRRSASASAASVHIL